MTVCLLFVAYSIYIYNGTHELFDEGISKGKMVWQKYNCQGCHPIYGLGGHLGPDLTNLYDRPGVSESYISAMIKGGPGIMPSYTEIDTTEIHLISSFLKNINKTGISSPSHFRIDASGMIYPPKRK